MDWRWASPDLSADLLGRRASVQSVHKMHFALHTAYAALLTANLRNFPNLYNFYHNSVGTKQSSSLKLSFLPLLSPAYLYQKDERVLSRILTTVNLMFPL